VFAGQDDGDGVASWKQFRDVGFDPFLNGTFAGQYEQKLIAEFEARLPKKPPWIT
jgi:hypothetical protein